MYKLAVLVFEYLNNFGGVSKILEAKVWRLLGVIPWPINGSLVGFETEFEADEDWAAIKTARELIKGLEIPVYAALLYEGDRLIAAKSTLIP